MTGGVGYVLEMNLRFLEIYSTLGKRAKTKTRKDLEWEE